MPRLGSLFVASLVASVAFADTTQATAHLRGHAALLNLLQTNENGGDDSALTDYWLARSSNVALNSAKGLELLQSALQQNSAVTNLALISELESLETQMNEAACAPASAVTVLNAMRFKQPVDPTYQPYAMWTQESFIYHDCAKSVVGALVFGETLGDFSSILKCLGLKTKVVYGASASVQTVADELSKELSLGHFVIANFNRSLVHESSFGHFSPVGTKVNGMFLVLDVARYKFAPTFVPQADLVAAMASFDAQALRSRGFVSVWA